MNRFVMSIERYFSGKEFYEVDAGNKDEAKGILRSHLRITGSGNYNTDSICVVKKIAVKKKDDPLEAGRICHIRKIK